MLKAPACDTLRLNEGLRALVIFVAGEAWVEEVQREAGPFPACTSTAAAHGLGLAGGSGPQGSETGSEQRRSQMPHLEGGWEVFHWSLGETPLVTPTFPIIPSQYNWPPKQQ